MAQLLSQPHSLKPRQPNSVWEAFHRCNLPPRHKDFIHKALWARLPVGHRQQSWKPLEVWCPINQELETAPPRLIRQGILTIGQLLEQPTYLSMLAPTWEPIYRHRLQVDQPLLPASLLPTFALPPQPSHIHCITVNLFKNPLNSLIRSSGQGVSNLLTCPNYCKRTLQPH